MTEMIQFDLPKNKSSIIKVIGVGGGGSNAVNHMFKQGIEGVDFIVCNTDSQALEISPIPVKVQIGASLTEGRGAGSIPAVGKNAAIENIDQIKSMLDTNTKMLFITAGMGGGTGTGAAPVIAATAKEMGILTVAIVTIPFSFEGRKRKLQAEEGIKELRKNVDTLLVICNDKLRELYGNQRLSEAFGKADNILTNAAKGIAEIITVPGYINVDFEDVKTVMKNSGVAIMGSGFAEGENRALEAVEMALSSPLLNDNQIKGASNILLYIASGKAEITMDEVSEITEYIQRESGSTAEIIWGNGVDESLDNMIGVTLIATGFNSTETFDYIPAKQPVRNVVSLEEEIKTEKEEKNNPVTEKEDVDIFDIKLTTKNVEKVEEIKIINESKQVEITNEFTLFENTKQAADDEPDIQLQPNALNEPIILVKTEEPAFENKVEPVQEPVAEKENVPLHTQERIKKLKELSMKIKTQQGVSELEKEPAYVRRNVVLSNVIPSSESHISKFTLSEGEDKKVELRQNNSFLHDNVD
ncbi:MAG TPA: cell division protein FtsZ [Bacteroidales bacterium]|nr:cell division protein FtsZ [Bacteroidales bacterium]HPS16387.1 cell division protein FtsZ [Bacteroidales bacterium]